MYELVVQRRSCHPGPSMRSWEASKSGVLLDLKTTCVRLLWLMSFPFLDLEEEEEREHI